MALTARRIFELVRQAFKETVDESGRLISEALYWTTINHQRNRWTRAFHSPDKITKGPWKGSRGEIGVNNPDVGRAYRDVVIRPVRARKLTIPCHREAIGRKAGDFKLFRIRNGLYRKEGPSIVRMFHLVDRVVQPRDESYMPSDEAYFDNVQQRFWQVLNWRLGKLLSQG